MNALTRYNVKGKKDPPMGSVCWKSKGVFCRVENVDL